MDRTEFLTVAPTVRGLVDAAESLREAASESIPGDTEKAAGLMTDATELERAAEIAPDRFIHPRVVSWGSVPAPWAQDEEEASEMRSRAARLRTAARESGDPDEASLFAKHAVSLDQKADVFERRIGEAREAFGDQRAADREARAFRIFEALLEAFERIAVRAGATGAEDSAARGICPDCGRKLQFCESCDWRESAADIAPL
jgi:hypothetical protein